MPLLHNTFTDVYIHTAKCDLCNKHNKSILYRCADCGWHICTPCRRDKGGDGTHVVHGGDRGWQGQEAPVQAQGSEDVRTTNRRSARTKTWRRRRLVVEEDSEEEEEVADSEPLRKKTKRTGAREPNGGYSKVSGRTRQGESQPEQFPSDVRQAAEALLREAMGNATSTHERGIGLASPTASSDGDNISTLLAAAAELENPRRSPLAWYTTALDSAAESADDMDAQLHSPLFIPEEVELEEEPPVALEPQDLGVAGETELPLDTARAENVPRAQPVARRLRLLYRESLLVRIPNGRTVRPFSSN